MPRGDDSVLLRMEVSPSHYAGAASARDRSGLRHGRIAQRRCTNFVSLSTHSYSVLVSFDVSRSSVGADGELWVQRVDTAAASEDGAGRRGTCGHVACAGTVRWCREHIVILQKTEVAGAAWTPPTQPGSAAKRTLDIVVSATALLCALPAMLLIAFAICSEDGFPIFFCQTRMG